MKDVIYLSEKPNVRALSKGKPASRLPTADAWVIWLGLSAVGWFGTGQLLEFVGQCFLGR